MNSINHDGGLCKSEYESVDVHYLCVGSSPLDLFSMLFHFALPWLAAAFLACLPCRILCLPAFQTNIALHNMLRYTNITIITTIGKSIFIKKLPFQHRSQTAHIYRINCDDVDLEMIQILANNHTFFNPIVWVECNFFIMS